MERLHGKSLLQPSGSLGSQHVDSLIRRGGLCLVVQARQEVEDEDIVAKTSCSRKRRSHNKNSGHTSRPATC